MTDRDVRNACHALLALQKQYAQLERAGEDTADSLELYRELELDIQAKGKLSEKYARTLILHPLFGETFQTPWARLLQPLLVFLQSTLEHHASLVNLLALEVSPAPVDLSAPQSNAPSPHRTLCPWHAL